MLTAQMFQLEKKDTKKPSVRNKSCLAMFVSKTLDSHLNTPCLLLGLTHVHYFPFCNRNFYFSVIAKLMAFLGRWIYFLIGNHQVLD